MQLASLPLVCSCDAVRTPQDGQGHTGWGFYPKIFHARASALSTAASYSRCVKSLWARKRLRAKRNFIRRLKETPSLFAVRTSTNASSNSSYSLVTSFCSVTWGSPPLERSPTDMCVRGLMPLSGCDERPLLKPGEHLSEHQPPR